MKLHLPSALFTLHSVSTAATCAPTLSIKQTAERLSLGKPKGAKSNLHKWMNGKPEEGSQPHLDI